MTTPDWTVRRQRSATGRRTKDLSSVGGSEDGTRETSPARKTNVRGNEGKTDLTEKER